jgi:hypothetical protein
MIVLNHHAILRQKTERHIEQCCDIVKTEIGQYAKISNILECTLRGILRYYFQETLAYCLRDWSIPSGASSHAPSGASIPSGASSDAPSGASIPPGASSDAPSGPQYRQGLPQMLPQEFLNTSPLGVP